ncbi:hypothetical protein AGMMS49921_07830 [Endomicrobiia bacterium]|nr:hypothetical protein AGMMS49921_07830 [Endomicrobiia bacterium]
MPGIRLNYDINEKFSLNGKLFAGIAMTAYNIGIGLSDEAKDKSLSLIRLILMI